MPTITLTVSWPGADTHERLDQHIAQQLSGAAQTVLARADVPAKVVVELQQHPSAGA